MCAGVVGIPHHCTWSRLLALLDKVNLEDLGIRQNNLDKEDIGTILTAEEIGLVLKRMKPNKTPGIDGITAESLKVFWRQLKFFITKCFKLRI